tara:strand:- start:3217 stop:3966 length:750 start_codon:yes stop_codon:yes gene_type:complete
MRKATWIIGAAFFLTSCANPTLHSIRQEARENRTPPPEDNRLETVLMVEHSSSNLLDDLVLSLSIEELRAKILNTLNLEPDAESGYLDTNEGSYHYKKQGTYGSNQATYVSHDDIPVGITVTEDLDVELVYNHVSVSLSQETPNTLTVKQIRTSDKPFDRNSRSRWDYVFIPNDLDNPVQQMMVDAAINWVELVLISLYNSLSGDPTNYLEATQLRKAMADYYDGAEYYSLGHISRANNHATVATILDI